MASVDSLWSLPGRRSRRRYTQGSRIASEPLVPRHTGRLQSDPTCATRDPRGRCHPPVDDDLGDSLFGQAKGTRGADAAPLAGALLNRVHRSGFAPPNEAL